ncbi:HEAT repeat-containing protein 1-like isoform 4-T7 [Salvelinus alpinus]
MPSCRPSVGSGQPGKTLTLLASGSSPVVLSLLACLSSSVCEVRRTATATLQTLAQVDSSPFHPTIDRRAMGKFCEEAGTGTGKARDKTC